MTNTLYNKPIRFDDYTQIERALELGLIKNSLGYLPYEFASFNADSFPTIFWYVEEFNTFKHQPEYDSATGERIWERPEYFKIVDEAVPYEKLEKEIKGLK